jgi:hypothetical protein
MSATKNQSPKKTDWQLKLSYWYVTHKLLLRQGLAGFLILLSIGLYGYALYRGSIMFFIEQPRYLRMFAALPNDLIDYAAFRQHDQPRQLSIVDFASLPTVEGSYDFVALVRNDNQDWITKQATAQLVNGGAVVAEKAIFIYPGREYYVVFFNQAEVSPAGTQIRLSDIQWQRFQNFNEFGNPRLNFVITTTEFQPVTRTGLQGELPVSSLNFTITNDTAFSYWQVGLTMVLLTGGQGIGGVNFITLDQFRAGETRDVTMRWYESLPPIASVKIVPTVDILNPASYMPVE